MTRRCIGNRPLTSAERTARSRRRQAERLDRLEALVRELLADVAMPERLAAKCRDAINRNYSAQADK